MNEIPGNSDESIIKLDAKDRKLLFALDFNSRDSYSQLSKHVGLSKQGTEYKINSLIKKGVIKGFYPVINVPKLGYHYCRLLVTLHNVTAEERHTIIDYLKENQKVFWLFEMHGMFDLLIAVWTKTISEFREFRTEFQQEFGPFIKQILPTVTTDVVHYQNRYLTGEKSTKEVHVAESQQVVNIDDTDKKILQVLSDDARVSLVKASELLRLSPKVIAYRIKRMEREGLISGYRPVINHNKIGYIYCKVFIALSNITKGGLMAIKEFIKASLYVIYGIEGIGSEGDIEIEMMLPSETHLFSFIDKLRFSFPKMIGGYKSVFFKDTLKVKYLPF